MRAVWISLLLFGRAFGQTVGPPQNPATPSTETAGGQTDNSNVKPEDKAAVEGKILNAATGEPLKKAHVTLRRMDSTTVNAPPYGAITDAAGHFAIESIDPGRYHMSAERTGYIRSDMGPKKLTGVPDTLTLTAGQKLSDLQFRLTPQAVIAGRVVDEDNEPVANASVQCARYRYLNGKKTLTPTGYASTNDKGEYRAFGLAAGKYYVSAIYGMNNNGGPAEIRADAAPEEGYVTTYYPNAFDAGSAIQVNVAAGAELSAVDIRLVRAKSFQVKGRVTNPAKPSFPVQIMFMKHGDSAFGWQSTKRVMTDANNGFTVRGVMPGLYDLEAVEFSAEPQRVAMTQVTVGDSNVDGLEIAFGVNPEVNGVFKIESGAAQPRQNGADLTAYRVSLYPEANTGMNLVSGGIVKQDASFTFKNVMPEIYRISVYPLQGDVFIKQIVFGDKELTNGRIDFSGGVEAGEIKVVLSLSGAQLEGSVLDSKQQPSPHATVVLVPETSNATERYKSGTTDQNGRYALRGLAPGKYKLYALDQIDAGAFYDADYMGTFAGKAETIEVSEGAKLTQDLQLIVNEEMQ